MGKDQCGIKLRFYFWFFVNQLLTKVTSFSYIRCFVFFIDIYFFCFGYLMKISDFFDWHQRILIRRFFKKNFQRQEVLMISITQEEANRGKPNWEHLSEDLHVLIQCEDTPNRAVLKLKRAVAEVKKLLVPSVSYFCYDYKCTENCFFYFSAATKTPNVCRCLVRR